MLGFLTSSAVRAHSRFIMRLVALISVLLLKNSLASASPSGSPTQDRNPLCADWAAEGECERNAPFMFRNCAQSCASTSSDKVSAVQSRDSTVVWDTASAASSADNVEPFLVKSNLQVVSTVEGLSVADLENGSSAFSTENVGVGDDCSCDELKVERQGRIDAEEQFRVLAQETEQRVTLARASSFNELVQSHIQDIEKELYFAEKAHKREKTKMQSQIDRLERDVFKLERLVQVLESRARQADAELVKRRAAFDCKAFENRIGHLQEDVVFMESQLGNKRAATLRLVQEAEAASEREKHLKIELEVAQNYVAQAANELAQASIIERLLQKRVARLTIISRCRVQSRSRRCKRKSVNLPPQSCAAEVMNDSSWWHLPFRETTFSFLKLAFAGMDLPSRFGKDCLDNVRSLWALVRELTF